MQARFILIHSLVAVTARALQWRPNASNQTGGWNWRSSVRHSRHPVSLCQNRFDMTALQRGHAPLVNPAICSATSVYYGQGSRTTLPVVLRDSMSR
jgi:hypothetical protein